jgi:activator of HSP90 ATPase
MIQQTYTIKAPVSIVWQSLVEPEHIQIWSGSKAVMSDKVGAEFSLWDGDIYGTNTKVHPGELLEQDWFGGDWPNASRVVIEVSGDENNHTHIKLTHTQLPAEEEADFANGWHDFYFGPLTAHAEKING